MSDADTPERTVTEDGIILMKSYETDEFPVPTVEFRVRSERDDGAMVRLVDTVPDGIPPGDLGFHPDHGGDDWTIEGDSAVFERHIASGEEYRTVYGIRTDDHDADRFMTDPELDVSGLGGDSPAGTPDNGDVEDQTETADATTPGRDSSQAARDVIAGEDVPGLDGEDTAEAVDISGTGSDPTRETEPTEADAGAGDAGTAGGGQARVGVPEGGVGAALAAELRNGELAETDRELLAEELDTDGASGEVRFSHLQSRISDLEAYTDALEEFIDEHGPARQLIEDLTEQVADIEDELAALDERTSETEAAIERLEAAIETNAADIEALDSDIDDAQTEIDETQASVADLRADIDAIEEWRGRISSVLGGVSDEE
jgi:predicted  nucleic acid-binding Zn-ribbon protein